MRMKVYEDEYYPLYELLDCKPHHREDEIIDVDDEFLANAKRVMAAFYQLQEDIETMLKAKRKKVRQQGAA